MPDSEGYNGESSALEVGEHLSPALEILPQLNVLTTLSEIEARIDSLEIDIARSTGTREDEARRAAGELAIMRARIEDALSAVTDMAKTVGESGAVLRSRIEEVAHERASELRAAVARTEGDLYGAIQRARAELSSALEGERLRADIHRNAMRRDVEEALDTMSDLRTRIEDASVAIEERQGSLESRIEEASRAAEDARASLGTAVETTGGQVAEARAEFSSMLEVAVAALGRERESLDRELRALRADVERTRAGARRDSEALRAWVRDLRRGLLKIAEDIGSAALASRRLAAVESRLEALESSVSRLRRSAR